MRQLIDVAQAILTILEVPDPAEARRISLRSIDQR